ncbi:MAG: hypothetical protein LBU77_06165, partial [Clostridiales bacterium]|nr:hypothetical protein [Clostridiales bacterium]
MENNAPRRQTPARASAGRRHESAYRRRSAPAAGGMSYKEKFVLQCIACGVILAGILLVKIIDVPPANALESSLQTALTGNTSAADIQGAVGGALEKAGALSDSLKTVLGNAPG